MMMEPFNSAHEKNESSKWEVQKSWKCTKALFESTNHCKKMIVKRNLIDQSVIKAEIFAQSTFDNGTLFMVDDTVDVVINHNKCY